MGIICATKPHAEGSDPDKEINDIAETAAQPGNRFKEDGYGAYDRHDRQGDKNEGSQQLGEVEIYIFMTHKLHHAGGDPHYRNHDSEHGEITYRLTEGVKEFA